VRIELNIKLTWAVKGIAGPCFVDWSHTVLSIVLRSRIITDSAARLHTSSTSCTAGSEHSPVTEATIS